MKSPPRPPAFAFVEFEEQRSAPSSAFLFYLRDVDGVRAADEAVKKGDVDFRGTTLRIEVARGGGPAAMSNYGRGRNARSPYRVLVKGLPPSASWQDVKVRITDGPCSAGSVHWVTQVAWTVMGPVALLGIWALLFHVMM